MSENDQLLCTFVQSRFIALLEGSLAKGEARQVKAHLRQCPACHKTFLQVGGMGIFRAQTIFRLSLSMGAWMAEAQRNVYESIKGVLPPWLLPSPQEIALCSATFTHESSSLRRSPDNNAEAWADKAHEPDLQYLEAFSFAGMWLYPGNDYY